MFNNTRLAKFSYVESQGTTQFNSHFSVVRTYASQIRTINTSIRPTSPNLVPHGNTGQVVTITLISNHYYTALLQKHDTFISSRTTITVPRLIAPAMALGLLFRRPNHAPTSFNFSWPKGVSAENKKKMNFMYGQCRENCSETWYFQYAKSDIIITDVKRQNAPRLYVLTGSIITCWVIRSMYFGIVLRWIVAKRHFLL